MKTPEEYLQDQILLPEQGAQEEVGADDSRFIASLLEKNQALKPEVSSWQTTGSPSPQAKDSGFEEQEPLTGPAPSSSSLEEASGPGQEEHIADTHQFVGCRVCGQEYALPLGEVQEVLRRIEPTRLPNHPPCLAGVVNLRNSLVPLLRLDLLLEASGKARDTHQFIIVCRSHASQFGLLVERITTMHTFEEHDVEWSIDAQLGGDSGYLSGLIKNQSRLIGIISVERIAEKVLPRLQG